MVGLNETDDIYSLIRQNNTFAVRLWLDNLVNDVHQSDEHGFTLLHWATWYGRPTLVQMLLERGARINAVNRGDDTPLHLAVSHNHLDIVQQLLNGKAQINAVNIHGNTPLHYACFHRFHSMAKYLIEQGHGLLYVVNRYGQTPLDLCSSEDIRQELQSLARQEGQEAIIIPYEERHRMPVMPMINLLGSFSTPSVVDIRELNYEHCLQSNHRKELWQAIYRDSSTLAKIFKLRHCSYTPTIYQQEIDKLKTLTSSDLLVPFAVCHDAPNLIVLTHFDQPYQTLFHFLHKTNAPMELSLALKFVVDIGHGMAYLHGITTSIRPQFLLNSHHVMVRCTKVQCPTGQIIDGHVAQLNLADCRFAFESSTEIDQPAWVAPEVLENGTFTNPSDIWSFAVVLWELFTRRIPFVDFTPMQCGLKIVRENLRLSPTGVSTHIDKVLQLCIHNDPSKRPRFDALLPIIEKIRF